MKTPLVRTFAALCALLVPFAAIAATDKAAAPAAPAVSAPVVSAKPAAMEVPVQYDLGIPGTKPLQGFITGGAICEPEGFSVTPDNGTEPVLFPYESLEKVTDLALKGDSEVTMKIVTRDGKTVGAIAKVTDAEPILVLRDELATGTTEVKVRTFNKAGFRGIPLLDIQAEAIPDVDVEAIKKLNGEFVKALDENDFDKAVDLYNQIGDELEKSQVTTPETEDDAAPAPTPAPDKK